MAIWRYGLVFSLALIATAANECRDRVEAFDFPLKYVTVPHDTPLDWRSASEQCKLQHPGYDLLERRYWSLNEQGKAPCKDHLVPLGLLKYDVNDVNVVVWHRTPPGLDGIRPRDTSNHRQETNLTGNEFFGALNLTDGTWHWEVDDSTVFTCVICQHADNNSLIIDDFERHPCFWRDSWINKTVYQVTLQHVAAHVNLDEYEMEEMVACAFNLTHDFVVIFEDDEEGNKNEVIAHMALNGTFDTQQYIGRAMEGYNITDITVIDKLTICPEGSPPLFHRPNVISADDCRDRHEAIDFPLKYVTVPDDKPLDWNDASKQCKLQHPGYDLLERRYLWLSEQQKAPCKDLLVPLGLVKYVTGDGNVVVWQRLPPALDRVRPTDLSKFREVNDLPSNDYYGALNLTDGTWHWTLYDSPTFICVICQHADNNSLIIDDFERHPCF